MAAGGGVRSATVLEGRLDLARPTIRGLAATIAAQEGTPVTVDLLAAGLDTIASMAAAMAADLRGVDPLR